MNDGYDQGTIGRLSRALARTALAAASTAALAAAQNEVYRAENGLLVIEMESGHASGQWRTETSIPGYTGDSYLRWDGPNYFSEPGHDVMAFEFELPEGGRYHFRIRNRHDHPDSTEENDVWTRMDGGQWLKTFSWQRGQWTFATQHEFNEHHKPPAEYQLTSGRHTIEFSGRSHNFMLDRFHLYRDGVANGEWAGHPESPVIASNRPPVAIATATPNVLATASAPSTTVVLDSTQSFDPDGDPIEIEWQVRGAQFVGGTNPRSPVARVRFPGGTAFPARLVVREQETNDRFKRIDHAYVNVAESSGHAVEGGSAWYPLELQFHGPMTHEHATNPNPFLDYRLQVLFTAADGTEYDVPGFYAGNGAGGGTGDVWAVRFAPDRAGVWSWVASFRTGPNVATSLDPMAGTPTHFDGATGMTGVLPRSAEASGFRAAGRLEYVGEHYLKQRDGGFWLKGGTNSPENLLAYAGFDHVEDMGGVGIIHRYERHRADFRPGDPLWTSSSGVDSKGIIGALNYLADVGINSIYFLPMNLGGDAQDVWPFVSPEPTHFAKTHYDVSRMRQWQQAFDHAQERGILLHVVLAETEAPNENWLDGGALGVERKLFMRELVARFGSALGLKWNLCEENDYPVARLREFADYLLAVDPYDHPIGVHTHPDQIGAYTQLLGDPRFSAASVQYTASMANQLSQELRHVTRNAGRKWLVDMDEHGTWNTGLTDTNADQMRLEVLYDVFFSGGQVEWYAGYHELPLGGDVRLEDFRTREQMWRYTAIARRFVQVHLPFQEMFPGDHLVTGESSEWGGAEVFTKDGHVYAVYLPNASQGFRIDLTPHPGNYRLRWFDPRNGQFHGTVSTFSGGAQVTVPAPPVQNAGLDWIALIERTQV